MADQFRHGTVQTGAWNQKIRMGPARGRQIRCDFGAADGKCGSAAQVWSVPSGFQGRKTAATV